MPKDAVKEQPPESDEALAARVAQGDQAAFVALYDRHFAEVYDFLLRLLLSPQEAAQAILSTFVRLRRQLASSSRRRSPRVEALAAAYRTAIEGGEPQATRIAGDRKEGKGPPAFAEVDPNRLASPQEMAQAQAQAPIVWEAVSSLDRAEYALLDLRLRRRLNVVELARVVGMGRLRTWSTISRLKNVAEDAFTSLLMLRLGRGECATLGQLAAGSDKAILPPQQRGRVSGHVAVCPTCSATKSRLVSPLRVLAALLPVEPPPGVRDTVLQNLLAYTAAQAAPGVAAAAPARAAPPRARSMGPPPPQRPRPPVAGSESRGGPAFAVLLGAAAAIALPLAALALWMGVLSDDGTNGSVGAGPTLTPLQTVVAPEGCGPPMAFGAVGAGTPPPVTCTPTRTTTATPTPTAATAPPTLPPADTPTPAPTDTATPAPTATATELPTRTPLPTPQGTETPVAGGTPLGVVETATPEPSPPATPTAASPPTAAVSPSPSP